MFGLALSIVWLMYSTGTLIVSTKSVQMPQKCFHGSTDRVHIASDGQACRQGSSPFSNEWLRKEFDSFARAHAQHPKRNRYGTQLPHQFALWATIKLLQPETIIESGVFLGHASWLMRQAAPKARMILLEPRGHAIEYRDLHNDTVYLTGKKFVDFSKVDWRAMNVEPTRAFVFFDDHQSGVLRTMQARRAGFKSIVFDDNFSVGKGDNLSLRKACYLKTGRVNRTQVHFQDNFGKIQRPLTDEDLMLVDVTFDYVINAYYEFPFVYKDNEYKGEVLFPNYTYSDIKVKFSLPNTGDEFATAARSYSNVCFVSLRQLPDTWQ